MANDSFKYMVMVNFVRQVLAKMPDNCPSRRETDIQNEKLERMSAAFRKKFTYTQAAMALGAGGAGLRKEIGAETHSG